jgi:hypothetical protein
MSDHLSVEVEELEGARKVTVVFTPERVEVVEQERGY